MTPLSAAIESENIELIKILLSNNYIDVNETIQHTRKYSYENSGNNKYDGITMKEEKVKKNSIFDISYWKGKHWNNRAFIIE